MDILNKFKKLIEEHGALGLLGSDGACPCADGKILGIEIDIHCWRTGNCCASSGVHVKADQDINITKKELKAIGKLFAEYIKEAYSTDCKVVINS